MKTKLDMDGNAWTNHSFLGNHAKCEIHCVSSGRRIRNSQRGRRGVGDRLIIFAGIKELLLLRKGTVGG